MSLILIEQRIQQLDYKTHSSAARIMDELFHLYQAAEKANNKFAIINILRILHDWISSINNNGLYSKLSPEHKDFFDDQMKHIAMHKVLKGLQSLRSKIEIGQKVSLVRKSDKSKGDRQ